MSDQALCERSSRTGCPLDQDRVERVLGVALQQAGMDMQRMLVDAADAEHPAIARATADRPPDLVGQGLKGDLVVGLRQGAADRAVGPSVFECLPEGGDRLLVASAHHVHEAMERDQPGARIDGSSWIS